MRNFMIRMMLILGFVVLVSMTNEALTDWPVPANYKSMVNPYKGKKDADGIGKDLWMQHCKSCHGKEGYGDGKKADELETELRDFTTKEVQSQTDGEIYYKMVKGRDEMPSFNKKVSAKEDRWLLVNYIRTLKE